MKEKLFYLLVAWLLCIGNAMADNIVIKDVTVPQGGTIALPIGFSFTSTTDKVGFTFSLGLPAGISLVVDADGDPVYEKDACINKFNILFPKGNFAGQPQNATTTISGTSGTLLTLQLSVDNNLEPGSVHVVNVTKCTFQQKVEGVVTDINIPDFTFKVTIEESDGHVILDETAEEAPEAAEGVDVRVLRTINANEWSTICLPFAMTAEQIATAFGSDVTVEIGDADSYETTEDDEENIVGITIKFIDVTAIEANHPYVIRVSKKITSFVVDGVVVAPATSEKNRRKQIGRGSYFVGNYKSQTEVPEFCLFLSDNKFSYSLGETKMKAFRGYFDLKDVLTEVDEGYNACITMNFDSSEPTGIRDNIRETIADSRYYDLQGRRVEQPGQKGMYIRDGRKMIVK